MLSTKIVEIPVDGGFDSNSINFDAFDAFDDYFFNSNKPNSTSNQLTQSNLANHQPLQANNLIRESDAASNASSNSFFGFDDYNNNFLSDDDPSFLQSSLDLDIPQSPVMDALSQNFNGLRRPSMEELPTLTQKEVNKHEKVEKAEDSSDSEAEEIETNPLLIKKALNTSQTLSDPGPDAIERANGKKRIKVGHNHSPNSLSSYSSESELEDEEESDADVSDDISEEDADASDEDSADSSGGKVRGSEPTMKKYKLPVSLRAENLIIGNWSLKREDGSQADMSLQGHNISDLSLDVKILFGRKKIKYEMATPNKQPKAKSLLAIDFTFNSISGLWFNSENREIVFQLSEPPTFTKKEKGRSSRTSDFTEGNAIRYCKHYIYVESDLAFTDFQDRLLSCDKRLRQLTKLPPTEGSPSFPKEHIFRLMGRGPVCDWDKENPAIKRCEDCAANYCAVCDDVLHRHENRKNHSRVPVVIKPPQPPRARRTPPKKRKKMNSDRCRCGTGATKGTLGEPCTGNRCPCFSNGKNCANCGCKNCANPIKVNKKDPSFSPKLAKPVATGRSGRAGGVRANSSGENLIF